MRNIKTKTPKSTRGTSPPRIKYRFQGQDPEQLTELIVFAFTNAQPIATSLAAVVY